MSGSFTGRRKKLICREHTRLLLRHLHTTLSYIASLKRLAIAFISLQKQNCSFIAHCLVATITQLSFLWNVIFVKHFVGVKFIQLFSRLNAG